MVKTEFLGYFKIELTAPLLMGVFKALTKTEGLHSLCLVDSSKSENSGKQPPER